MAGAALFLALYAAMLAFAAYDDALAIAFNIPPLAALVFVLLAVLHENRRLLRKLAAEVDARIRLVGEVETRAAELERLRAEAQHLADHDVLTGILNRRAWFARATEVRPTAIALFDIDFFKAVNDTYGHPAGDAVLTEVAQRLGGMLGSDAVIGRLGGEEFGVLLSGSWDAAIAACRSAIDLIPAIPVLLSGGTLLTISASAGLAPWRPGPTRESSLARTYEDADRALYEAKESGRMRLVTYAGDAANAA